MTLSDLVSIGMTLGTGIIIFANIVLMSLMAYYREEKDSLRFFSASFMVFGIVWMLYVGRIFDFFQAPISLIAAFFYFALSIYYIASNQFLARSLNYYALIGLVLAYVVIYWSPILSTNPILPSMSQAFVTLFIYAYFSFIYYRQYRRDKNLGHIIIISSHSIILLAEMARLYLLMDSVDITLILGLMLVAHTIALILNNVGIMTAFSFAHYKAVKRLSKKDSLTGLLNRRGFFELYQTKSNRYQEVAVISCDIDYFKTINDNHGHSYGDQILKQISNELNSHTKQQLNKESLVARWGGEEFIIALFDCTINQARLLADSIREAIYQNEYEISGDNFNISLSFGVAHHRVQANDIEHLINQSDKALYQAKMQGRNQFSCQI